MSNRGSLILKITLINPSYYFNFWFLKKFPFFCFFSRKNVFLIGGVVFRRWCFTFWFLKKFPFFLVLLALLPVFGKGLLELFCSAQHIETDTYRELVFSKWIISLQTHLTFHWHRTNFHLYDLCMFPTSENYKIIEWMNTHGSTHSASWTASNKWYGGWWNWSLHHSWR